MAPSGHLAVTGYPVVPFRLIAGRIVVEATLDSRPIVAIIDTCAPLSLVRADLVTLPVGKRRQRATFQSEHGPVTADLAGPACLELAGRMLALPRLAVMQPSLLGPAGIDADMIVGQDVLSTAAFQIDFENRHIQWRVAPKSSGPAAVPISLDEGRRVVIDLALPKVGRVAAIVDFGSNAALTMDADFVRRHGLADGVTTSSGLFATSGGISETLAFSLSSIAVGGTHVLDVPVDALPCWSSPQPINIGIEVLRRFHLVLDLVGGRLEMRPIADAEFEREMSGLLVAHRGSYLDVVHIAKRSPAEAAEFRHGDRIMAINGVQVDMTYFSGDLWRWRLGPAGRLIRSRQSMENVAFDCSDITDFLGCVRPCS